MQSLCQDPQRNSSLAREHFPLTDNLGSCRSCQFGERCGRMEATPPE